MNDDAVRMYLAECYLFGALPVPLSDVASYTQRFDTEDALLASIAAEVEWLRGTVKYQRHAAGLPPMEPPSLNDINRIFRSLSGHDLSSITRDN